MRLVTLQQASDHLRRDTTADDADLLLKIEAASEAVMGYLGDAAEAWTDSAGEPLEDSNGDAMDVPRVVQSATLQMVSYLYRERDGSNEYAVSDKFGYGYLPAGVTALLYRLRKPTVA